MLIEISVEGVSISVCVNFVILVPEVGEYLFNVFATDAFFVVVAQHK